MMTTMKELARNLLAMLAVAGTLMLMLPRQKRRRSSGPIWRAKGRAKQMTEMFFLRYSLVWISGFGAIIALQMYEWFTAWHYMAVAVALTGPLLLQPLLAPGLTGDAGTPLLSRHSLKANVWIAIYSFIGNYFYTHYFYVVLKAEYTLPSFDLNGVPIPMFFYTHFYFSLYHTLASMALRSIERAYAPSRLRTLLYWTLTLIMAYITGAMETITIAGFPCYKFEDFHMAVILGSAMYGIYFIVSYPMYKRIDEEGPGTTSLWMVVMEVCATGMIVYTLLDFVRVSLGIDMRYDLQRPCKLDPSRSYFRGSLC